MNKEKAEQFKSEIKGIMEKYNVRCENIPFDNSNGTFDIDAVFIGGDSIQHRYEIFLKVADVLM